MKKPTLITLLFFVLSSFAFSQGEWIDRVFNNGGRMKSGILNINGKTYLFDRGVDLSGANLEGADLDNIEFKEVNFTNTNFSNASILGSTIFGCNFSGANFYKAKIRVTFSNLCNFTNANFTEAELIGSIGWGSIFSNAIFKFTNLTNTRFWGESGFIGPENGGFFVCDFDNCDFSQSIISNTSFGGSKFCWSKIFLI
jgi:Uncharacterized low-complexity proteins